MENKEYVFTTSYNESKLAKLTKHVNKKQISILTSCLVVEIVAAAFCFLSGVFMKKPVIIGFSGLFTVISITMMISRYRFTEAYIKKNFKKIQTQMPISVTITLNDKIRLYNVLPHGEGSSVFEYSGVKEVSIVGEYIFIKFNDNRFVSFEAEQKEEVLQFIQNKIKEGKEEK